MDKTPPVSFKILPPEYAAAVIDATITVYTVRMGTEHAAVYALIKSVSDGLLERSLHATLKIGNVTSVENRSRNQATYSWTICKRDHVRRMLSYIAPYALIRAPLWRLVGEFMDTQDHLMRLKGSRGRDNTDTELEQDITDTVSDLRHISDKIVILNYGTPKKPKEQQTHEDDAGVLTAGYDHVAAPT